MPVTARVSKRFYEVLGEDVANELVDWFNAVDLAYRGDLRELNFARFDAKLEQRLAELRAELRQETAGLGAGLRQEMAELRPATRSAGRSAPLDVWVLGHHPAHIGRPHDRSARSLNLGSSMR